MENHSLKPPVDITSQISERDGVKSENKKIEMLNAALENVSDIVLVTDRFGKFVYFNDKFASFNKHAYFSLTAIDYPHLFEVSQFDGPPLPLESWPISRALRGESGVDEELRVVRRDTSMSLIGRYNFSPLRNDVGEIIGAVVVGRDITQERAAEKRLKDLERRARVLLEKTAEHMVGLNLDGTYCFVNHSYARMLGRDPEQIVRRSVKDLLPFERAEQRLQALRQVVEGGKERTTEFSIIDGDGRERFVLTTAEPIFDDQGSAEWVLFIGIDITERKLAEVRLSESEAKYRRLFEHNSDALLLFDGATFEILEANPAAEALYGYTCQELAGIRFTQLSANEEEFLSAMEMITDGRSLSLPHQLHRKKDGRVFPVEMTMTSFQLGGRTVMQPIIRDISERLRVEERLSEVSRRLQLATHSAKIGIWDWDIQSDTILWDDRMHELYGKPKGAGVGRKGVIEWAELIHPEDRDRVFSECLSATLNKESTYDTEFRVIRPDKSIVYLKANGLVLWNEEGVAERMIGTNADITEQKEAEVALRRAYSEIEAKVKERTVALMREGERLRESERRLKRAQELGRIGHWSVNIASDQVEWSDEVYRIFGFDPQSDKPTRDLFYSLILPESRERVLSIVENAFRRGESYEMTFPFQRPDGSTGIGHSMAEVEFDAQGNPFKYSGVVQDVTEQKTLEQDLRSAVELRDEFMSIASHELKTPLTALNMRLQLLKRIVAAADSDIDRRICTMSQGALSSVKALSNLIDDLLDVTRIRAGKLTLSKEDMDLKAVLERSIHEMQPEAHRAGTRISFWGPEAVQGYWDPARIVQVIRNLISNAIKYGEASPISVTLSQTEGEVCLTVRDNGIGISQELQAQIFERFQRATSGNKITGLGLGLYIVRQIVKAHGGSIQVESTPGKGSLFTVKLPRVHK